MQILFYSLKTILIHEVCRWFRQQSAQAVCPVWTIEPYQDGALDSRTKELLGLVTSMVLRCDDCNKYHLGKCHEMNVNTPEVIDVFAVANTVGCSICIPHTRRALEY